MVDIDIPYYGKLAVKGFPYCEGCQEAELEINESKLMAEGKCVERIIEIRCENLRMCSRLRDKIREENNL